MRSLADPVEIARLRAEFERIHASPVGISLADRSDIVGDVNRVGTVPQITHLERYTSATLDSPVRARCYEIARDLLGPEAELECETMILKLPQSPDATPWHQDEGFWSPDYTRDAVSFWIALQDVGTEGGCMEFLPGSHLGDVLPHQPVRGIEDANAFELVEADTRFRVVCPLPAGGGTVHHARTAHSTGPNATETPRFAYILVFGLPGHAPDAPREFPWQGTRGRDKARAANHRGLDGFVNRVLRFASIRLSKLTAANDRRMWLAAQRSEEPTRGV